jgi:twinkle protein
MQVQKYLEKKGFQFKRRGEEAICNCPLCDPPDTEKKFSINLTTGKWQCFHKNRCGVGGMSLGELQKKLGDTPEKIIGNPIIGKDKKPYTIPKQEIPGMENNQVPVYKWLLTRGFNDKTIKYFHLGAKDDTIMFPYRKNGVLVNVKYRNIKNKKEMRMEKDAEPTLFNRDNIQENVLNIVEGENDCIALYQYEIESVSVPNGASGMSWIDTEWEYLETFRHINIVFDNDPAGKEGAIKLANRLGLWRCSIVTLPYKDANECLLKNVPPAEIYACFTNAKELTPEDLMVPSSFGDKIKYLFAMGKNLYGIPTAWPDLTDILKGWRPGEVTIWTGKNGAGKSTMLNQHVIDITTKGEKACIYSGEMPPERYLRWALIQMTKKNVLTPQQIDSALSWMDEKIYILNISSSIEPDSLFANFEYSARRYGVKQFIVDSLMKIRIDLKDEYNQQAVFISQACDFAKKYGAHVHIVAHPRKSMKDQDEPGKVDVKGNSHITDLADNVIVLFRPDEDLKEKLRKKHKIVSDMTVYVKKNREFGTEGRIYLRFDPDTKNFSDIGEEV